VVDSLQSVLEMAESPVLLEALVRDISLVAKQCPQHLEHHFKVSSWSGHLLHPLYLVGGAGVL